MWPFPYTIPNVRFNKRQLQRTRSVPLAWKKDAMNTDKTDLWNTSGFAVTRLLGFVRQSKENFKPSFIFLSAKEGGSQGAHAITSLKFLLLAILKQQTQGRKAKTKLLLIRRQHGQNIMNLRVNYATPKSLWAAHRSHRVFLLEVIILVTTLIINFNS